MIIFEVGREIGPTVCGCYWLSTVLCLLQQVLLQVLSLAALHLGLKTWCKPSPAHSRDVLKLERFVCSGESLKDNGHS